MGDFQRCLLGRLRGARVQQGDDVPGTVGVSGYDEQHIPRFVETLSACVKALGGSARSCGNSLSPPD